MPPCEIIAPALDETTRGAGLCNSRQRVGKEVSIDKKATESFPKLLIEEYALKSYMDSKHGLGCIMAFHGIALYTIA